ncbi:DEAD/DEAH box helicase domain-containing protein [Ditylenchus destructor]|nr:DEAD/DEAH box helicase domain-containing protein [Ditylenchus destructor]
MAEVEDSSRISFEEYAPHVRLFQHEGVQTLIKSGTYDFILKLLKFTNPDQQRKIEEMLIGDKETRRKACELLFISASDLVKKQLKMTDLKTQHYYYKFCTGQTAKLDRLAATLEPAPIIEYLKHLNCRDYDSLIERVEKHLHNRRSADAACELIRSLPYCSDTKESSRKTGQWYYDFLEACLSHGYTRMLPRFIDPHYADDLEAFKCQIKTENLTEQLKRQHAQNLDDDFVEDFLDSKPAPRSQEKYEKYRMLSKDYSAIRGEYVLYSYQNELVTHARAGRNTIICAPTGSGKTLVAIDIVINHMQIMREKKRLSRCVFLVPTVPLVSQQAISCTKYTINNLFVDGISGAEAITDRAGHFLATDLCVMTPQILINMLNSPLKHERVYLSEISMLIVDECHHAASGDHPYKVLLDMLREYNDDIGDKSLKPQIIGLTASVGVGKQATWDINKAKKHILELCSIMMADSISTVRRYVDDLRDKVTPPVDKMEKARRPENDIFGKKIKDTMFEIQQRMVKMLEPIFSKKDNQIKNESYGFLYDVKILDLHTQYQAKAGALRKILQRLPDSPERMQLIRSADHLAHYFHAIGMSDLLPNRYGLQYLQNKMNPYQANNHKDWLIQLYNEIEPDLENFAINETVTNKDILQKLYQIIRTQYTNEPESRTLIFVSTRNCAQKLSEHLQDYLYACNDLKSFYKQRMTVGYMTSSNQSALMGGQSSSVQEDMRILFDRGDIKILVVTSVAEEGIDIKQCNLIIKYNNVGSERTMIQRRGRARDKNSQAILLALDSGVEQQEFENFKKEQMMQECIKDLQAQTDDAMRKMINDTTQRLKRQIEERKAQEQDLQNRLSNRKYRIKCRVCSSVISESMDVRRIAESSFVCCDKTVFKRTDIILTKRPTKLNRVINCAEWVCKCGQPLGTVLRYANVTFPAFRSNCFNLERIDESEDEIRNLKWGDIQKQHFNVYPISNQEIKKMAYALKDDDKSREIETKLEARETMANQMEIDKYKEKSRRQKEHITLEE